MGLLFFLIGALFALGSKISSDIFDVKWRFECAKKGDIAYMTSYDGERLTSNNHKAEWRYINGDYCLVDLKNGEVVRNQREYWEEKRRKERERVLEEKEKENIRRKQEAIDLGKYTYRDAIDLDWKRVSDDERCLIKNDFIFTNINKDKMAPIVEIILLGCDFHFGGFYSIGNIYDDNDKEMIYHDIYENIYIRRMNIAKNKEILSYDDFVNTYINNCKIVTEKYKRQEGYILE